MVNHFFFPARVLDSIHLHSLVVLLVLRTVFTSVLGFRWVSDINCQNNRSFHDRDNVFFTPTAPIEPTFHTKVSPFGAHCGNDVSGVRDQTAVLRVLFANYDPFPGSATQSEGSPYILQVVGAEVVDLKTGRVYNVSGSRVVLGSGLGSAPIMLASGIGPADYLRSVNITPRLDVPKVRTKPRKGDDREMIDRLFDCIRVA